jgi:hypothetical protein
MNVIGTRACRILFGWRKIAIALKTLFSRVGPVNEFYKKGCQEKSSASTGGRDFSLEIQPTVVSQPWRSIGGCLFLVGVSPLLVAMFIEFERAASRTGAQGQPWFYRRLVAYRYFWFSEGA